MTTTERFTKEEFECFLPKHKETGQKLWTSLGLVQGEYTYLIHVKAHVYIMVRSSVMADGYAADTADNSIRLWLVDEHCENISFRVAQNYVTRLPGWGTRLRCLLQLFWKLGVAAAFMCPTCGGRMQVFAGRGPKKGVPMSEQEKAKKLANKGRIFMKCPVQPPPGEPLHCFYWLTDPKQPKKAKKVQ